MAHIFTKQEAEYELTRCRAHLILYPNHFVDIASIKRWEEFLRTNYPESELLIAEPKAKAEPKPKAKAEPKPKAKAEPKPKAKAEPKPKAKAEPKPKADAVKPCIKEKEKKKKISAAMKKLVWNTNIGEEIGKSKCMCCQSTDITQMSFNCGHIVAEAKGGATIVSNLKPICQNCNSSMGTNNMNEFMKSLK